MTYFITYIATLVAFLLIDGIWLGFVAKDFYFSRMDHLMREEIKVLPAAVFYLMYVAGVVYLVTLPQLSETGTLSKLAINAFILGLIAYGTYDMTNYAVLRDFPLKVALVDWLWGGFITASSASFGYMVAQKFAG